MIVHSVEMFIILLALSVGVTAIAKWAGKPYPIALVLVGAAIGFLPIWGQGIFAEVINFFASEEVFRTAVVAIFLPALLGEASLKLSFADLQKNRGSILALAFGGTLLAFAVTGGLAYFVLDLPLQTALAFGALMSATDPVSVIAVFKSLGVNRRLALIMEGESLINDGVAVVLFKLTVFSLASIAALGPLGVATGIAMFAKVVLGGIIVGVALGFLVSQAVRFYDDYPLENTFSIILFYGAYFIGERLGVSGVIAVVAAGLVLGNYGKVIGMTPTTRLSISVFWDTITLVANSLVFILVGLEISRIDLTEYLAPIFIAILLVFLGRSAAVYISTMGYKLPWKWKHILNWGGLKGSLSLALALSLPPDFTGREVLIVFTFGVVFFSLVVQGLTIAPLIRAVGLKREVHGLKEYETHSFALQQALSANTELEHLYGKGMISPSVFEKLAQENRERVAEVHQELDDLYRVYPGLLREQEYNARKKLLYAEHEAVEKLLSEGILSEETGSGRKRLVLEQIETLRKSKPHHPEPDKNDA